MEDSETYFSTIEQKPLILNAAMGTDAHVALFPRVPVILSYLCGVNGYFSLADNDGTCSLHFQYIYITMTSLTIISLLNIVHKTFES